MSHTLGWGIAAAVVAAGVAVPVWWYGQSPREDKASTDLKPLGDSPTPSANASPDDKDPPPKMTEFATGNDAKDSVTPVKFDEVRALKYVQQLCDLGPRISGSETMKKQQEIIEKHFTGLGLKVTRQEFKAKQRSRKEATDMVNLIVSWQPEKPRHILLSSHYDTRPIADQERNPGNWHKPFVSANDGTSGVAFFMELGNHLKDLKCEYGVDFVLFDGEEYVFETSQTGGGDKYFFGSEHFADEYTKTRDSRKFNYTAGLLFDLFAAKNAELKVESYSYAAAAPLVEQVWKLAKDLGAKSFKWENGWEVQDDHLALIRAGIPTIDIIDFDYPHWHKLTDTPDKISGSQLAEVSKVVTVWLQRIK